MRCADPDRLLGTRGAASCPWFRRVGPGLRVDLPDLPLVRRRRNQPRLQRARPSRRRTAAAATRRSSTSTSAASAHVLTYAQLLHAGEARRGGAARPSASAGRSRHDLHADLPEAIVLMLATVRIGAIHSVVFAGFGASALGERIEASGSKAGVHGRRHVSQGQGRRAQADRRRSARDWPAARVEHVVVLERSAAICALERRATIDVGRLPRRAATASRASYEAMEANEPAFILATSGTTAKPKLAVHTHGGYQVHIVSMARWCFGLEADGRLVGDVGHRLDRRPQLHRLCAAARRLHDGRVRGRARSSDADAQLARGGRGVRRHRHLHVADRRAHADALRRRARSATSITARLERVVCAGEVLNPPAWDWLQNTTLGGRVPVIDHMWQTETGGPVFGNPYGIALLPIKPGSAGIPLPGIEAAVVNARRHAVRDRARKGSWCSSGPFPGMTPALWGEPERYGTRLLGADARASTTPATRRMSTTTATSGLPAAPTKSSRSPRTASARSRSRARSSRIRPSPSAAWSAGPTRRAAK